MSSSPSTSPPRTPDDNRAAPSRKSTTPSSDESSILDDLSFDYILDDDGNFVRLSKGSTKSEQSSPPTPQEAHLRSDSPPQQPPPKDFLASPVARISLSRSESAFPALSTVTASSTMAQNDKPTRSFQRVASGPAIGTAPSYLAPTTSSLSKPRSAARRVTLEDDRDAVGISRTRQTLDLNSHPYTLQEEKENISESDDNPLSQPALSVVTKQRSSPPLATRSVSSLSTRLAPARLAYLANGSSSTGARPLVDVPLPQRNPHSRQIPPAQNRPGRVAKTPSSSSKYGGSANFDRNADSEGEQPLGRRSPAISITGGDDTEPEDDHRGTNVSSNPSVARQRSQGALAVNASSGFSGSSGLSHSGDPRPRRSASLSDPVHHDEYQLQLQHQYQNPSSRPGTSSGVSSLANDKSVGPKRVTQQERESHEIAAEYKKYRSQLDELDRMEQESNYQQSRQSPSPTHQQLQSSRLTFAHRRRDSDTLRSTALGSPTVMDGHRVDSHRISPPPGSRLQVRQSPPGTSTMATRGRVSPSAKVPDRTSPPVKGRLSPASSTKAGREVAKHRRSPTAPEPPTNGITRETSASGVGKTWAGGDKVEREQQDEYEREREKERREREREREREQFEREREREKRSHQSHLSLQNIPQQYPPAPAPPSSAGAAASQFNRHIVVNKKAYARLDMIGKGGSSRVFRVLSHANELYAIKRVSLDKTDAETMSGYMNEIALLKRLEGNSRIIRLIDSEVKAGPAGSKGYLMLVMECGEIDFARLLQEQMKEPLNMVWVSYYWQQMLQAVHVIHEEKIVHSDLKPANFVLVRGQLKLIDFGIANAIANDTTNIQRDHQIGTVNYMSPEAIELPDGMRRLKVGRPSDVWSLGCILYQMIYGHPPFQHLSVYQKMKAIPDLTHVIEFADYATPVLPSPRNPTSGNGQVEPPKKLEHLKQRVRRDVISSMKSCLSRGPKERATIPELLNHSWLALKDDEPETSTRTASAPVKELLAPDESIINPYYMRQLLQYGIGVGISQIKDGVAPLDAEQLLREAERLVIELKAIQP